MLMCVFAHSRFIENPPIRSWETTPSFLRWFCHIATPGAYVLVEVDGGMLPNTWNVDQLHKYYA
jgi:hypothetical protein